MFQYKNTGDIVSKMTFRGLVLLTALFMLTACSAYQPTKDVWKGTKNLWNTYVSQPAVVDYDEKGDLSAHALVLTNSMMGIDVELGRLERVMLNADKPPTREWISDFFVMFPWISSFAGVKYDGTILGQEPAQSLKQLDFIPLLYEDKKQNIRALRGDVQPSSLGPEVMLASPLYDGTDFLGIVAVSFDIRNLMQFSDEPESLVIFTPHALLWPGKYDFASTPLSSVDWAEVVTKSSAGTCSNATGSFYYLVRYLGNLPLIFAVPESGDFPEGDGSLEQGYAFFPQEREKLPPPPMPERKSKIEMSAPGLDVSGEGTTQGEIQPGSQDSILLQEGQSAATAVQERQLEGQNVPVERPKRQRKAPRKTRSVYVPPVVEDLPDTPPPVIERPSPFGPQEELAPQSTELSSSSGTVSSERGKEVPVSPAEVSSSTDEAPKAVEQEISQTSATPSEEELEKEQEARGVSAPAELPGGRFSPFGPHR